MIGIPVLILVIIGAGANQGLFSDVFDKPPSADIIEPKSSTSEQTTPTETHSKCGKGTILDPKTNSCVLDK